MAPSIPGLDGCVIMNEGSNLVESTLKDTGDDFGVWEGKRFPGSGRTV